MAEPLLAIEALSKAYGAVRACDGVSLDLAEGEIHALIGPNGAGKTTLIGQITGEIAPDAGAIRLDGLAITDLPVPARAGRGIARTYQITSVLPRFSALDNVLLAALAQAGHGFRFWRPLHAEAALVARAREGLARVGLEARAAVPVGALSHGERRVLEIAMALASEPRLLLLDEPTAGMGREDSARMVALLGGLKGRVTILLVEHDMDAVFALADRITVLVNGAVVASGVPEAIRADPEVRRAYLGEPEGTAPC